MFFGSLIKQVRCMQYLSATIASLACACTAMHSMWLSPSLPKLTSTHSPIGITITPEESSWLASTLSLGLILAAFVKMFITGLCGPKMWLLISGIFLFTPWIIIYFANSVVYLFLARFVAGMGAAIVWTAVPTYIGEISENDIRGKLIIIMEIMTLSGSLFVLIFGPFLSFTNLALCCGVLPIIFVALLFLIPESPYYLTKVGETGSAVIALKQLSNKNVTTEFVNDRAVKIEETVSYDMKNKSGIMEFILKKDYRKSLVIVLGAKTILQLSGLHVIHSYAQTIISKSNSSISPEVSSILFGVIQIPAAILSSFLVDKVGRKPLWIISAAGCALALTLEGLYFSLSNTDYLEWLPTTSILLFFVMAPIGVTALPFVYIGEIFATNVKSVAITLSIVYGGVISFVVIKGFEPLTLQFGLHVAFWTFAVCCILGCLFILFIVPETKKKSFQNIQIILNKKRKANI